MRCAGVPRRSAHDGYGGAATGDLAHGAWDAYHFRANQVVNRPWSEFCWVVDLAVGTALLVAAAAQA
jgi:hypothetical protein